MTYSFTVFSFTLIQKPTFVLFVWLTLQSLVGIAQRPTSVTSSPYQLRKGRELTILGVGVAAGATSLILEQQVDPLTPDQVRALDRASVPAYDRGATYNYNLTLDKLRDVTLAGNAAIGGALVLGTRPMRQDFKTIAVMYAETFILANGLQRSVKNLAQRTRPFVYNPDAPLDEKLTRNARQSFFSGHTTNAFATAVFTGELFRHYFPQSRWKAAVWGGSFALAATTILLSYEGGQHFPSDLLAGAVFGSVVGWGIPKLHEVRTGSRSAWIRQLDVQPWSNGQATGVFVRWTPVYP
ncbi:phosphoesterase PA-phosphatase related protein [Fibrisoma limi BUZ 3]|uniref:Phosphoesterase PA-phosphatase related protein n=1 Tax=Fibrisoma limi BUZ 3 TaxID=1185876 RepID=I2GHB8_9BACT|nr:phosphatase PAP2 family protein [Fibrisoma limi]CCH53293.1 phosphoesterase PA-phosphatase related protein [Fibrisoma limi BUZ 3]